MGVLCVKVEQSLFESRQTEKIVLFFNMFDRTFVNRAIVAVEIVSGVVGLACNAIQATVCI